MVQDANSYGDVELAAGVPGHISDIPKQERYVLEAEKILNEKATPKVVRSTFDRYYLACPGARKGQRVPPL